MRRAFFLAAIAMIGSTWSAGEAAAQQAGRLLPGQPGGIGQGRAVATPRDEQAEDLRLAGAGS